MHMYLYTEVLQVTFSQVSAQTDSKNHDWTLKTTSDHMRKL